MTNIHTLTDGAKELGIRLTADESKKFLLFKELLKEWNQKINITSITDDMEIDIKHFLDSITLFSTGLLKGQKKLIDIGTGGGFPGIPLKIMAPDLDMVLLDSLNKRIIFLDELVEELKLKNIIPIHGRAEEVSRNKRHRQSYDIAVSRAVAALNTLCEYCMPFVRVGGHFISMKGPDVEEELDEARRAIDILGGKLQEKKIVTLPFSDIKHSLIIIEKVRETPTRYPRGGGNPKKRPL